MSDLSKIINRFAVLKQIPVFNKLRWFDLQRISGKCEFVQFKKGEIIREQGSPPDAFYCVIAGRIKAYVKTIHGGTKDVEYIHRGMYFGIISLLTGENHSLTFEALNDSVILKIEKAEFYQILEAIPKLGIELSQSLSRRVRSRLVSTKTIFESTIISIYSPTAISGASTYALNLSLYLHRETSKKAVFVCIRSSVRQDIASEEVSNSARVIWKKEAIELKSIIESPERIAQNITHIKEGVNVLHVSVEPNDLSTVSQISYFVSLLAADYHFVIVDLPNQMDQAVLQTLTQSDIVHLVAKDDEPTLRQASQVIEKLKGEQKEKFNVDKVQIILSGMTTRFEHSYEDIHDITHYGRIRMLAHFTNQDLAWSLDNDIFSVLLPDIDCEYAHAVRRIARQIGGVLVGLVLGGGAALGVAHIGVIRVLEKAKIPIDVVVGSSIGALIGSLWAVGKDADELEKIAREFEKKRSTFKLIDMFPSKSGLSGGYNITRWLKQHLGNRTFYSTRFPLKVVAYDLLRREELVIEEGSIVDGVRQSIAIPGVISPIVTRDRLIIDGGVVNPLPANVLAGLGIKKIIAVNVLQSPSDVVRGYEIIEKKIAEELKIPFLRAPMTYLGVRISNFFTKAFYPNIPDIIVRSLQAVDYIIAEQSAQQADIVIHPDLAGISWFELYEVKRIIQKGEEAAMQKLPEIQKLVSE